MKQIIHDLQLNANDRLKLWIRDTIMRCEAVDLEEDEIFSIIFAALTHELVVGVVKLGQPRENFIDMMWRAYDMYDRITKEIKGSQQ